MSFSSKSKGNNIQTDNSRGGNNKAPRTLWTCAREIRPAGPRLNTVHSWPDRLSVEVGEDGGGAERGRLVRRISIDEKMFSELQNVSGTTFANFLLRAIRDKSLDM
ncbi:hypothetical protein EVAR_95080_1 [Eumeta japonica]|uniref:Uncharacterized protein n=1 Tax=Eumeta variegata TaxID=151549 RepID=A0A4C1W5K9_EUMVA|nr:hypothetical protein EVAR_95080_1 [Eumeta japonica]